MKITFCGLDSFQRKTLRFLLYCTAQVVAALPILECTIFVCYYNQEILEKQLVKTEDEEEKMLTSRDHSAEAWLSTEDDVRNSKTQDMRSPQNQVSCSPHLCYSISSRHSLFDVATCASKPQISISSIRPRLRRQSVYLNIPCIPQRSSKRKKKKEKNVYCDV